MDNPVTVIFVLWIATLVMWFIWILMSGANSSPKDFESLVGRLDRIASAVERIASASEIEAEVRVKER